MQDFSVAVPTARVTVHQLGQKLHSRLVGLQQMLTLQIAAATLAGHRRQLRGTMLRLALQRLETGRVSDLPSALLRRSHRSASCCVSYFRVCQRAPLTWAPTGATMPSQPIRWSCIVAYRLTTGA